MNSVGQSGDKKSYRVVLLLVVGLTAFSSAMKELNYLREFTREASNMMASWSHVMQPVGPVEKLAPVEVPRTAVRLEACESNPVKFVEPLDQNPSGGIVAQEQRVVVIKDVGKTVVSRRSERREEQIATLRKQRVEDIDIDVAELQKQARRLSDLKVTIMADGDGEGEIAVPTVMELKPPKMKTQWKFHTPAERDVFLKNLHRSINLRSAG